MKAIIEPEDIQPGAEFLADEITGVIVTVPNEPCPYIGILWQDQFNVVLHKTFQSACAELNRHNAKPKWLSAAHANEQARLNTIAQRIADNSH